MEALDLKLLVPDSGKSTMEAAADYIITHSKLMNHLFEHCLLEEPIFSPRLARVFDAVGIRNPELTAPYINRIIFGLKEMKSEGVKRSLAHLIIRNIPREDDLVACLINTCFDWMNDSNEAIAVRYYAMKILFEITKIEPEIRQELAYCIEDLLPKSSAGMRAAGQKLLLSLTQTKPSPKGKRLA